MFNASKKFLKILGPGIITGASDDDPSGIATYSQTGAQFGYGQLWTALYLFPLLAGVQEACARIGVVTGKGIAAVVRQHFSKPVLYVVVVLVLIANTINIGADIGAMAAAASGDTTEHGEMLAVRPVLVDRKRQRRPWRHLSLRESEGKKQGRTFSNMKEKIIL